MYVCIVCMYVYIIELCVCTSQKSLKRGLSMAFKDSLVDASTDTYSCVTGSSCAILSGNCAFVTKKEDIRRSCSSFNIWLMCGYMIGSPTRDSAQCLSIQVSI